MKHILTKYLIKELLVYYLMLFLFFFMIFFVNQILLMVQDVLKQRVSVADVLKLMLYSLPFVVSQAAPFATLVGFLMCIGRMVTDNEILVMRALGMDHFMPVIIVGILIALGSFIVNDVLMPRGTIAYNKLYRKILLSNPGVILEPNSVKRTQDSILVIGDVNGSTVSDLVYFDFDSSGNQRIITSETAKVLQPTDVSVLMQIDMQNAMIFLPQFSKSRNIDFFSTKSTFLNIFSSSFFNSSSSGINPREMTTYDLKHYIAKLKKDNTKTPQYINVFEVEYYRKFALPFSSIFFAFLALPLALVFGKHNGQTAGFIVGVGVCFLYWTLQTMGQVFGQKNGFNAFWVMWLPDIFVGLLGLPFYIRMRRS